MSRRVSHELIRNYVGADRDEEGSPSQESTRYTEHPGYYIAPPHILGDTVHDADERDIFQSDMQVNYNAYLDYVRRQTDHASEGGKKKLTTPERKAILESASPRLAHTCDTSFVWTTNPMALAKMMKERDNPSADREFQRFAHAWKRIVLKREPNLYPQPWMR